MIQGFQIDIMKGLFIKGTANWYYSEGLYESFTKDYMDNMLTEHYTKHAQVLPSLNVTLHKRIMRS